jgi:ribosome-binding protein aMBF1 (putative translation factor)
VVKRITPEQRELAWQLYQQDKSISSIAKSLGISYFSARLMTYGREQGLQNTKDYANYLAERKASKAPEAPKICNPQKYKESFLKRHDFADQNEYNQDLAERQNFKNYTQYYQFQSKKRSKRAINKELKNLIINGLKNQGQNQSWLAEQLGKTRQTISLYSQGKIFPPKKVLKELISILELRRIPKALEELV